MPFSSCQYGTRYHQTQFINHKVLINPDRVEVMQGVVQRFVEVLEKIKFSFAKQNQFDLEKRTQRDETQL